MTIGKNIAELRKNSGMTQEQLAETLGVSAQTVSKWENEVTMPDIMLLPVIAGCFDLTVDELYGIGKPKEAKETLNAVNFDEIPEKVYDAILELTQHAFADAAEGRDIDAEKARMKSYLAENREVKTATFSDKNGAVIATSEIGLLHRGKADVDQLIGDGIGTVLEILSKPTVRKVFAFEIEHSAKPITASYAAKKCNLSAEEAAEALELLSKLHVNHPTDIMVDEDKPIRTYSLDSGEWVMYVLMILKIARLVDEYKQHYFNYRGSYNYLWLK